MPETSAAGFWATALSSDGHLSRAVALLVMAAVIMGFTGWVLARPVVQYMGAQFDTNQLEVAYYVDENKVLFAKRGPGISYASVSAAAGWVKTGLRVKPDKSVHISSVGQANLALKELQLAIAEDRRPRFPWTEPEGSPCVGPADGGTDRCQLLIQPTVNIGALLAYLSPLSASPPSFSNPRPVGSQAIGSRGTIFNSSGAEAELYLAVNDIVLDSTPRSRAAYLGGYQGPKLAQKTRQWDSLLAHRYWSVWFDDNVGHYLVQLDLSGN